MKIAPIALVAAFIVAPLSARSAAPVDSARIAETMDRLEVVLKDSIYKISRAQVKGRNAEEMLLDYANDPETTVNNYPESSRFPNAEDGDNNVGLARFQDAVSLALSERDPGLSPEEAKRMEREVYALFGELKEAGALLGYITFGSSTCGVHFASPLVIDKKAKLIYEIAVVGGGC